MSSKDFNALIRLMGRKALENEEALIVVYERAVRAAGKFYARQFSRSAITAAGEWTPAAGEPEFDSNLALEAARERREEAALAIESVLTERVAEIAVSFDPADFKVFSPDLLGALGQQAGANFDAKMRETLASTVRESFDKGLSVPDTAKAITGRIDGVSRSAATMLARTDLISLANGGAYMAASTIFAGVEINKKWINAHDARVRPSHANAGGQVVPMDKPFRVGGFELMYPGDPQGPPGEVINCVPGWTRVEMPGLRAVTLRWYEGDLIVLRLASGDEFSATPNHPVLRVDGEWVGLGNLTEGDHLVSASLSRENAGAPDPERPPAEISEVYRLANVTAEAHRVGGTPPDFHGDGAYGEVDVVAVGGSLLIDSQAASDEEISEFGFSLALRATAGGGGAHDVTAAMGSRRNHRRSAACLVGVGGERYSVAVAHSFEAQAVSLGAGADWEVEFSEPADDYGSAYVQRETDREDAFPLLVSLAEVVKVDRYPFAGHVYNLDTGSGWYIGNSLVTRNCRCTFVTVEEEGDEERVARLANEPSFDTTLHNTEKGQMARQLLGNFADTEAKFSVGKVWSDSRRAIHKPIIAEPLNGVRPVTQPKTTFLAGGSGAGKGTIKKHLDTRNTVDIDPDEIKLRLPEYRDMIEAGDQYAAIGTHEESSFLAKQVFREANDRKMNVVVDGTGDGEPGAFVAKILKQRELGNDVEVVLVDLPVKEAVKRARKRAEGSGRHIATSTIEDIHESVARAFGEWRDEVDDWQLWATEGERGAERMFAARINGADHIYDEARFQAFLAKART